MTLAVWQRTIADESGNVIPGALVEVRREGSARLAPIKSDRAGAVGLSNPFQTGSDGFAQFFVVGGAYRIRAYKVINGVLWQWVWRYEAIGTAAELDADNLVVGGTALVFDDGTEDGDPGEGRLRLNHEDPANVTEIYVDNLNIYGDSIVALVSGFGATGGYVRIDVSSNRAVWREFVITGPIVAEDGYLKIPAEHIASAGEGVAGEVISLLFTPAGASQADKVSYHNSALGLAAKNAQDAVDEIAARQFDTVGAVAAASIPAAVNAVRTAGYSAAGDGGGALYKRVLTEPSHAGKIQTADESWWEIAGNDVAVESFGAVGDGSTNDYAAIQGGVNYLQDIGGGRLRFGRKVYATETGIVVSKNNVLLVGLGKGHVGNGKANTRASAATRVLWTGDSGTGTVLKFDSNPADDGTEAAKSGGGTVGVMIDGDEKALNCLELVSWQHGYFDVHCVYAQAYGYKLWTLENNVSFGSGNTMHNTFQSPMYTEVNTNADPVGMVMATRNALTNCCYNRFYDPLLLMDGDGGALSMENSDNNNFFGYKGVHRLGNATATTTLHADDTGVLSANSYCRHNGFFWAEGRFVAKATVAGSDSSAFNLIFGQTRGNGMPAPTIEPGARLQYWSTERISADLIWVNKKDDGAGAGPDINTMRDSVSPAISDQLGRFGFYGRNSAGEQTPYGSFLANIIDPTDGSEDGGLVWQTMLAGAFATRMQLRASLMIGTGLGDVGPGRVNAQAGYFVNTTLHVIDGQGGVQLPSYPAAEIASSAHVVNTLNKRAGKMVWDTTNNRIMVASGGTPTSLWVSAEDSAITVTPA